MKRNLVVSANVKIGRIWIRRKVSMAWAMELYKLRKFGAVGYGAAMIAESLKQYHDE